MPDKRFEFNANNVKCIKIQDRSVDIRGFYRKAERSSFSTAVLKAAFHSARSILDS